MLDTVIDSRSVGDPTRFRTQADLEAALAGLPAAPADEGALRLIVCKTAGGRRETPHQVELTPEGGVPGDAWGRQAKPMPDEQLTVMQYDVAELIANGQSLTLAGDNLVFDLNLSAGNLPIGSRLAVGGAVLEVTPKPHNGCRKFKARFGNDALQIASRRDLRHLNLRGVYMRVVTAGAVAVGDTVRVVYRPSPTAADDGNL